MFDLDGVLADLVEVHYLALNEALASCGFPIITREQQDSTFNGLPTKTKLSILGISKPDDIAKVYDEKQDRTMAAIHQVLKPDYRLRSVLVGLRDRGYRLAVASNAIRQTIEAAIGRLGISDLFEFTLSNQDVANPKPHPEIYLAAIRRFELTREEVLIVEDSSHGKRAALESGAFLCPVDDPAGVKLDWILECINKSEALSDF